MYFTIERNEESKEERLKVGERSHFSSVDSRIEITFYEKSQYFPQYVFRGNRGYFWRRFPSANNIGSIVAIVVPPLSLLSAMLLEAHLSATLL